MVPKVGRVTCTTLLQVEFNFFTIYNRVENNELIYYLVSFFECVHVGRLGWPNNSLIYRVGCRKVWETLD